MLARRIYELTTGPIDAKIIPTWDPKWRSAIDQGRYAVGTGDEQTMEHALLEIERLAKRIKLRDGS